MTIDVVIIGGGLSGLNSAYLLKQAGLSTVLIEGRDVLGGRIISQGINHECDALGPAFDLGPSWFWPGQPYMQQLIAELGLADQVYQQYAQGMGLYQRSDQQIFTGVDNISMAGSYRLKGGMYSIIQRLSETLESHTIRLNTQATEIKKVTDQSLIETTVINEQKSQCLYSRFVICALPPRLLLQNIDFSPPLSVEHQQKLNHMPTWMASQAKAVIQYPQALWKAQGFSGDVFSEIGPLREIHDASIESHNALFGFVGWSIEERQDQVALQRAIVEQLVQLFGSAAANPKHIMIKDWAQEPLSAADQDLLHHTPQHGGGLVDGERQLINNVLCSGAEAASSGGRNNGYLEGALESSHKCVTMIKNNPSGIEKAPM